MSAPPPGANGTYDADRVGFLGMTPALMPRTGNIAALAAIPVMTFRRVVIRPPSPAQRRPAA